MPKLIDDAEVYRAVIALVQKKGYLNTTTKQIAKVAGIHETTLFDKYGSKPELVLAALSFHMSVTPMKALTYTGDIQADLTAVMEAYQKTIVLFGDFINALILQIPSGPQLTSVMALLLEDLQPTIAILLKYQAQGALKQAPALQMVGELIAPFFMQHTFSKALQGMNIPDIDLERRVESFLNGFGTN